MILADILPTPTGNEFIVWLACAVLVLIIAGLVKNLFFPAKSAETPQPLRVTGETRFATHEELTELRIQFETFRSELRGDIKELQKSQVDNYNRLMEAEADGRRRVYAKIDDLAAVIHRMEGKTE
jgi:hypothetical protein